MITSKRLFKLRCRGSNNSNRLTTLITSNKQANINNLLMQRVYQAIDLIEANIVKGLLEQQQIEAHISGYFLQGGIGEIPPTGNTSLWVDDRHTDRAMEIIQSYENSPL